MGEEYDKAWDIITGDLVDQLFPETATWGLFYHELKWQLPVRENLPYEERRKLIYEKRDYRAPMTPYKMERFLINVVGMEVHVADIHDKTRFGYVPDHPNRFKVFFVGDETLNVKAAKALIDRLKQSQTVYKMNDVRELEIDESRIESFIADRVTFGLAINYWGVRMFDGSWLFDGQYPMDTHRRYGFEIGIEQGVSICNPKEELIPAIRFDLDIKETEKPEPGVTYGFDFYFWPYFYFDGSWLFNGERHLNARLMRLSRTSLQLGVEIEEPKERFEDIKVISHSRNYWFFDGSVAMDGSRNFDSVYREEDIV